MRLGIAHHLGWAVAVTATADHHVVDRRRIDLIEPGVPNAPVEHEIANLDDTAATALLTRVRASVTRATAASLTELAAALPEPIESMSIRAWPMDFPDTTTILRRAPYNARADSIMYLQILAEQAHTFGWQVHLYDAKAVEGQATRMLGTRATDILHGPRTELGPPWTKDHRTALSATVLPLN